MGGALAPRLRGLGPGSRRKRRARSVADRRLRRGDGRAAPGAARADDGERRGLESRACARHASRGRARAARPRHLGGARTSAALHALEGDGLGRPRSRHPQRGALPTRWSTRAVGRAAAAPPRRDLRACVRPGYRVVRAGLRLARGGRGPAPDATGRLPAADRRARTRDRALHREATARRRLRLPLRLGAHRRWSAAGRRGIPRLHLLARRQLSAPGTSRGGAHALSASARHPQRRRPPRRGVPPDAAPAGRQLSAGVLTRRAREHRVQHAEVGEEGGAETQRRLTCESTAVLGTRYDRTTETGISVPVRQCVYRFTSPVSAIRYSFAAASHFTLYAVGYRPVLS